MKKTHPALFSFFMLLVLALWSGLGPWGAVRAADQVQVESTRFQYDAAQGLYRYEDARVKIGPLSLDAQLVEVFAKTNRVVASGDVRFSEGTLVGSAARVEVDIKTNAATMSAARMYDRGTGYYLDAEQVYRSGPASFRAVGCTLTSCAPGNGGWKLEVSRLDYSSENFASGSNAVLWMGPVPVFYFPLLVWPTVSKRGSGFLAPSYAVDSSSLPRLDLGARLQVPFFWALGPDHDLTLTPQLVARRGVGLGLEYGYAFREGQQGQLKLFAIREQFERNTDDENRFEGDGATEGESLTPDRHYLDWGHNQGFGDSVRLVASYAASSDGQVRREYGRTEFLRPQQNYQVSASLLGALGAVAVTTAREAEYRIESLFANGPEFTDRRFRPSLAPRFALWGGWRPLGGSAVALGLRGEVTRFEAASGVSGEAGELTPMLTYPLRLGSAAELRTTVSRRLVAFQNLTLASLSLPETELAAERYQVDETRIEFRLPLARIFPAGKESPTTVKHRMMPRLIYEQVQNVAQPYGGSFSTSESDALDFAAEAPGTSGLHAGIFPERLSRRLWTLRLDNGWYSRRGPEGGPVAERATLNLIQRYNAELEDPDFLPQGIAAGELESGQGEPLLPAILAGSFATGGVTLSGEFRYHHQRDLVSGSSISLSGQASTAGTFGLTYQDNRFTYRSLENVLYPEATTLSFSGTGKASDPWQMGFSGTLNLADVASERRLEAGQVFLDYTTSCLGIRTTYKETLAVTSDGETFFDRLLLVTFKFGSGFALESRDRLGGY